MQRNVVTSATSVKLLLEGGCGFGCSLSGEGGVLIKFSLPRGATSKPLYFRLPRNVNACPKYWNEASRCHTLPNTHLVEAASRPVASFVNRVDGT